MIQSQVKLPGRVALDVVLQGIKIRFGRSVVTVTGVVMGIAFLMSVLTGQALRKGVADEDKIRADVSRMYNFLAAEMGPAADRSVGVLQTGELLGLEKRLLKKLEDEHLASLRWVRTDGGPLPDLFERIRPQKVSLDAVSEGVSALIVLGDGEMPVLNWDQLMSNARQRVVAMNHKVNHWPGGHDITVVHLNREIRNDELVKMQADKRKDHFRNTWIIIISLLVTVIGIANAMLMSVTERFREIGAMKCLGALSSFVRLMFIIESGIMGMAGGVVGGIFGFVFSVLVYGFSYGFSVTIRSVQLEMVTLLGFVFSSLLIGMMLSVVAAIYPASVASRMVPADALRTNV